MSTTITISNPIFDQVHIIKAWEDNNRILKLVQGEGVSIPNNAVSVNASYIKAPRFQLTNKRGIIDLTSITDISWAVQRPRGGEDLLVCNRISPYTDGIIEIPITKSVTEYSGHAYGEIRLTTDGGNVIKFGGINACITEGVSDDAAAQSSRFSALFDALQKVVSLQSGSVATMDDLVNGNLKSNGTNPVSSSNLNTYLQNNYHNHLKTRYEQIRYAYPDAITDEQLVNITNGDRISDCTSPNTLYLVKGGGTDNTNGDLIGVMICASMTSNNGTQAQYYFNRDGELQYRTRANTSATWPQTWSKYESKANKDTASLVDSDEHYASSKLIKTLLDSKVDATQYATDLASKVGTSTTVAGISLSDSINADDLMHALTNAGVALYYHVDTASPSFGTAKYVDVPVPAIWQTNSNVYLVLSRVAGTPSPTYGTPYTYSGFTIPRFTRVNSWDTFNPSTTSGVVGEILVGSSTNGVWICNGSTQWVQIATLSDLDNICIKKATVTLPYTSWSSGAQVVDVSSIYTLTSNTKVDIDVDSTNFAILQGAGCYGVYLETDTVSNATTLTAKVIGATPTADVEVQLIFSELNDLGTISGGDSE